MFWTYFVNGIVFGLFVLVVPFHVTPAAQRANLEAAAKLELIVGVVFSGVVAVVRADSSLSLDSVLAAVVLFWGILFAWLFLQQSV